MKTELEKLNKLSESHGALRPGKGIISGVIARSLAILCFPVVLAFQWPQYVTSTDQPVFRPEWQTDFHHSIVNHMIVGFALLATALLVHHLFGWAAQDNLRGWIAGPNPGVALFPIVLALAAFA